MLRNYLQLTRLDKPIGWLLLLWPTLWAVILASHARPSLIVVLVFIVEVILTRSAGCVINDIFDKDFDRHVARTQARPLACNAISIKQAWFLFVSLILLAFIIAVFFLSLDTILLSIPALIILLTYPLMKRFFSMPQAYLGVAFSFGIPMAYVQISHSIPLDAVLLFMANLFWVLGYDTIYALMDATDDIKIGMKTSALTLGKYVVVGVLIFYLLCIGLLAYLGIYLGFSEIYWISLVMALMLLLAQVRVISLNNNARYLNLFKLNNWVGVVIFIGIYASLLIK